MSHGRSVHPNVPLTVEGRRRMVECVVDRGWSVSATAERFQVDAKAVRKWRDRFVVEGQTHGAARRGRRSSRHMSWTLLRCAQWRLVVPLWAESLSKIA